MPKTKLIALAAVALAGTSGLALAQSGYGRGPDDSYRFDDRPYHRFDRNYHHGYDYGRNGRGYDDDRRMGGERRYGGGWDNDRGRNSSRRDNDDGWRRGMDDRQQGRGDGRDDDGRDWSRNSDRNDDNGYEDFRERFGLNDDGQDKSGSSQSRQSTSSDVPDKLRQKLQTQGYSEIKIVPGSYLVRARDSSGDPVFMVIGPHSTTMITALTPGSESSDKTMSGDKITGKSGDEQASGIDGSTNEKPKPHSTAAESAPATGVTKGPTSGSSGVSAAPDDSGKSGDQSKSKSGGGSGSK